MVQHVLGNVLAHIRNSYRLINDAIKLVIFIFVLGLNLGYFWGVLQENHSCEKNKSPNYSVVLQYFTLIYQELYEFIKIKY